jgi:hypothetical protein
VVPPSKVVQSLARVITPTQRGIVQIHITALVTQDTLHATHEMLHPLPTGADNGDHYVVSYCLSFFVPRQKSRVRWDPPDPGLAAPSSPRAQKDSPSFRPAFSPSRPCRPKHSYLSVKKKSFVLHQNRDLHSVSSHQYSASVGVLLNGLLQAIPQILLTI